MVRFHKYERREERNDEVMRQYQVTGMSCAACQSRVERAVGSLENVTSCSVSLLTHSMGVEGEASPDEVIRAVEAAGYGASLKDTGDAGADARHQREREALEDHETPVLLRRLIASLVFLAVLMYFSMGHMMWGWPLPSFFEGNHVAMGLVQMLLAIAVMVINQRFFINGFKSLFHLAPNMDALVALGSGAAFVYSTFALFAMTDAVVRGDHQGVMHYMDEFYFESAAMILALITVGKMLEAHSKGKTTDALKGLMELTPVRAVLLRDGKEVEVPVEQVHPGDVFVVKPGQSIPVDGVILEGHSSIDESALTGESIPVDRVPGQEVVAATVNQEGHLTCQATRVGNDTTLSQIIQMVSDAAATKAPIAQIADRVSGVFVPVVITLAVITGAVWLLAGKDVGFALARAVSVLVISCPCALGLATPVAIMVGNGVGARHGILFKNAQVLEEAGKVQVVALDKTGTITQGKPVVTDVYVVPGQKEEELWKAAAGLEGKSEHPLARAVSDYAGEHGIDPWNVEDFQALPGHGLCAMYQGKKLLGGSQSFLTEQGLMTPKLIRISEDYAGQGKTPMWFSCGDSILGMIAVADTIKPDSTRAIRELKNMGIHVVMLTGDHKRTAEAIGREAGVDQVVAGVLPDGKQKVIRELQKYGRVAMVGDGINDAPALTGADIGIAIGAGVDVAIDAAQIVLMRSNLLDVPGAIRLSRKTLRNIKENLFWAFIYNIIGIPLAAGVWIPLFGWTLNPMFGAAAMSLSSFCVVSNALRLNLCKVYDAHKDKAIARPHIEAGVLEINDNTMKGDETMTKTMNIQGMMCGHCEATVKKALEAIDGVASAEVSHEKGTAVVTLDKEVADEVLKTAVEEKDYTVDKIR